MAPDLPVRVVGRDRSLGILDRGQVVQLPTPVRQVVIQTVIGQTVTVPKRIRLRPRRLADDLPEIASCRSRRIELTQVGSEHAERPLIRDDVVHDQPEEMIVLGELVQLESEQRQRSADRMVPVPSSEGERSRRSTSRRVSLVRWSNTGTWTSNGS